MLKSVCAINGMPMRRLARSFTIVTQMLWEIFGRLFNFRNFAVQCIRVFSKNLYFAKIVHLFVRGSYYCKSD